MSTVTVGHKLENYGTITVEDPLSCMLNGLPDSDDIHTVSLKRTAKTREH